MDTGQKYSKTQGVALIIVSSDAVTSLIFKFFVITAFFFSEFTTEDRASLKGLINESTQHRQ